MLLDNDQIVQQSVRDEIYRPIKQDILSGIQYCDWMSYKDWLENVPEKIFNELFQRTIELMNEYPHAGPYTYAFKFNDYVLNLVFVTFREHYLAPTKAFRFCFVLSDNTLRDHSHRTDLCRTQFKIFGVEESENLFILAHGIHNNLYEVYCFMKKYRDKLVFQPSSN